MFNTIALTSFSFGKELWMTYYVMLPMDAGDILLRPWQSNTGSFKFLDKTTHQPPKQRLK